MQAEALETYSSDVVTGVESSYALEYEFRTRHDGVMLGFLLFSIIFGPEVRVGVQDFPLRFVDFVIVLFFVKRWLSLRSFYGGLLFSRRSMLFAFFIFVFIFVMLFSMAINAATGRTPFILRNLFYPIIFIRSALIAAIAASVNFGPRQVRQMGLITLLTAVLCIFLALDQKFVIVGTQHLTRRLYGLGWEATERQIRVGVLRSRVVGTFGNSNVFGGALVMLSGLSLALAVHAKYLVKYFAVAVYIALGFTILIATASRTALASYVMITGLCVVLSMRSGSRFSALILMVVLLVVVVFVRELFVNLPIHPRVKEVLAGGRTSFFEALRSRFYLWSEGLRRAMGSLLFGLGPSKVTAEARLTDNGYLYVLMRLGIVGLLTYLGLLGSLFVRGLRSLFGEYRPWQKALLLGALLGLITHMLFEMAGDFLWRTRYQELFAVISGMVCGCGFQLRNEQQELKAVES